MGRGGAGRGRFRGESGDSSRGGWAWDGGAKVFLSAARREGDRGEPWTRRAKAAEADTGLASEGSARAGCGMAEKMEEASARIRAAASGAQVLDLSGFGLAAIPKEIWVQIPLCTSVAG